MDVRSAILDAGSSLLREHGIAALTQPRVAAAAGVKQSHLTYYFPKRADLLIGIATHTVDGLLARLTERLKTLPASAAGAAEGRRTVLVFGDSLPAGYGLEDHTERPIPGCCKRRSTPPVCLTGSSTPD